MACLSKYRIKKAFLYYRNLLIILKKYVNYFFLVLATLPQSVAIKNKFIAYL